MNYWWKYSSTHKEEKIEKREGVDGLNGRDKRIFSFFPLKENSIKTIFLVLDMSENYIRITKLLKFGKTPQEK